MAQDDSPASFEAARAKLQQLCKQLDAAISDPTLSQGQQQRALNAFNAANGELQRLMAIQIQDLSKAYHIDSQAAKSLVTPLKNLQDALQSIQATAAGVASMLDTLTGVLQIVSKFV
ncbi:MAG TPA: hypothetical protein VHT51_15925 [Micropepsaceae bacterium]|jgi:hypothetical protein|nr:hypothetical protein [Micropepsaceae bacterium]